jgi:hypothetical protein
MIYLLDGVSHHTKASAQRAVQQVLNRYPIDLEFNSLVLEDLVAGYHYYCAAHGLRPTKFKKCRWVDQQVARQGYELKGWFGDEIGWHGVSYLKCLTTPTFATDAMRALRAAVDPMVRAQSKHRCEDPRPNHYGALEQDHVRPTFKQIFFECLKVADSKDHLAWETRDWLHYAGFRLPEGSPMVARAVDLHRTAVIRTLCSRHHRNVQPHG